MTENRLHKLCQAEKLQESTGHYELPGLSEDLTIRLAAFPENLRLIPGCHGSSTPHRKLVKNLRPRRGFRRHLLISRAFHQEERHVKRISTDWTLDTLDEVVRNVVKSTQNVERRLRAAKTDYIDSTGFSKLS